MDLVLATTNLNKLAEISHIFGSMELAILTLADVTLDDLDVEETGVTFSENAYIKARFYTEKTGKLCVADDSGLEVKCLNNQPGVASNRWHPGSNHERNDALLKRMEGEVDRAARFVTVVCLMAPHAEPVYFEGAVEGQIAQKPLGNAGFGYDPLFIPSGESRTFAELGTEFKNKYSHRARAFSQLKEYLVAQYQIGST
ncbi:MAG: RdgB/HAM1 family non-canonical purine NTP pyrophosphatase [Microgenomates group bacterium]